MNVSFLLRAFRRATVRMRSHDAGFTLIEAVLAMAIFAAVSTSLAGVLTSSISARSLASERTAAEQIANDQIEWIRSLPYDDVGLTVGNPTGVVNANGDQSSQGGPTVPALYTVTIKIAWVNDPTPTSYATKANYKNVTVTVVRARDSKQLTQQSTQVGPRQRAVLGGINKGTIIATVQDYLSPSAPRPDVTVNLTTGPSAPLSDMTDAAGQATFPALDPTPGSGPTAFYDLVVPSFGGWIPLPDAAATHFTLAAGSTVSKVLRIYKPVTLVVQPENSDGTPYSSNATFTVTGPEGTGTFSYDGSTGAAITVTTLTKAGVPIQLVPGSYTITPTVGIYADAVTSDVPSTLSNYPSDLSASVSLTSDPLGSVAVSVESAGSPVVGATVTVAGGPRSIATQTATTNASGIATFPGLPEGSGYTVTATKSGQSAPNQTVAVSDGATTNVTMVFPMGSLRAVVTWATLPSVGATVTLAGGPGGISVSGTSDVNGEVLFSNIPAGTGYTLTATKSGQSATTSPTVVGGTTTVVAVALPTVTLVATATWAGAAASGATISLSGGPLPLSTISGTAGGTGQVTFSNVPIGGGYTLSASKNGQSTTLTSQNVTTSPTTSIGVALPTGTIAVNAATWAGRPVNAGSVTISGGPNAPVTYTGTTNASGVVSITVPSTTASYPYTVTVTKTAGSTTGTGTVTVTSLVAGATATVSPALTPTGTIAINPARWAGQPAGGATVTITGGPNAGATYTGTTDASGVVSIVVPVTNTSYPYTVVTTKNGGTNTSTVTSLASGATATLTPTLTPVKNIRITVRRSSVNLTNTSVAVSITGGPNGAVGALPAYGGTATTDGNGRVTFSVPSGTGGYTIKVHVANCATYATLDAGSLAGVSSTGTTQTNVTLNLTSSTCPFSPLP